MEKTKSTNTTTLSIGSSKELRSKLAGIAKREKRTLSAQARLILEQAVKRAEEMAGLNEASR
jgi:predicted transcriptional regulator